MSETTNIEEQENNVYQYSYLFVYFIMTERII